MAKRYYKPTMIKDSEGSEANMPQGIVHKNYPTAPIIKGSYDDTRAGIDKQISEDIKGINRQSNKGEKF